MLMGDMVEARRKMHERNEKKEKDKNKKSKKIKNFFFGCCKDH